MGKGEVNLLKGSVMHFAVAVTHYTVTVVVVCCVCTEVWCEDCVLSERAVAGINVWERMICKCSTHPHC